MTDHTDTDESPDADGVGDAVIDGGTARDGGPEPGPRGDDPVDELEAPAVPGAAPSAGEDSSPSETTDDELDPELRAAQDPRTPGQMLVALEQAEASRDDYLDVLQRNRAEFDNYRRRTAREAGSLRQAGAGDLATTLLEALDDLDRTAEVAESSDDDGLAAGIKAVHRKIGDAMRAAGIQRVDEVDVPFDARVHEAVQRVPADEPLDEPEVAQVLRAGYVHGDRCLRAAMVVVRQ